MKRAHLSLAILAALHVNARAATYSLARDFSYAENGDTSTWSYRLDDVDSRPPVFPPLSSANRDANAVWGSEFPKPPLMWSEEAGYWGIGKNLTGEEQFSSPNDTRWAPGEVLLHPKHGPSPSGLVVGWTAPDRMLIDVHCAFDSASPQGNGIGYELIKRSDSVDTEIVAVGSIGNSLKNDLKGMVVGKDDQLFRFNTCGDPGGDISIFNINDARYSDHWDQIMSVPQRLTLGEDKLLRIEPVETLASLRGEHQRVGRTVLPANRELVLQQIRGNTMELAVEIDPKEARWVELNVLRSPSAEEQTSITFFNFDRVLTYWYQTPGEVVLDGSRSSTLSEVWLRPPERVRLPRSGEPLRLRVFIDRSVVEVFVNERQYLAIRVYPGREDSLGVSLRAQGQDAVLQSLDAWQMKAIWP